LKYLILIRKENNLRDAIFNSNGEAKDWSIYPHSFDDFEKAKSECTSIIKGGTYRAENVKIAEFICSFKSNISVEAKEE